MTITVRPAGPEDDAAIWDILRPIVEAGEELCAPPDGGRDGAFAYWRPPGATNFVAETDGRIVGTSFLRANQTGHGDHVANAGFATAGDMRGQGVARLLLTHAMGEAMLRGFTAMQFNFVVSTNRRAVETWERAGFAVVGRLPGAFRHPREGAVDALVMWRPL